MYDNTPLHYAVRNGLTDLVRILLVVGAKTDKLNNHGITPLCLSIILPSAANRRVIVKLLVEEGANTNLSNSTHGSL